MSSTDDSNGSSKATAATTTTTIKRSREELEQDLDAEQRAHKKTKTENEELKKANSILEARLLNFETEQEKNGKASSPDGMTTPTKLTTKKSEGSTVKKYKKLQGKLDDAQTKLEAVEAEKLKLQETIERITKECNVELGEKDEEKNFLQIRIGEMKARVAELDNILREISIRNTMVLLSQEIFRFVQKYYKDNPDARLPTPTERHQPQLHEIPPEHYKAPKAGNPYLRLTPKAGVNPIIKLESFPILINALGLAKKPGNGICHKMYPTHEKASLESVDQYAKSTVSGILDVVVAENVGFVFKRGRQAIANKLQPPHKR